MLMKTSKGTLKTEESVNNGLLQAILQEVHG